MISGKSLLAVLVALSLGWAYVQTHRGPGTRASGGHTLKVWEADTASLRELVYSDGKTQFRITPEVVENESGPYLWVRAKVPGKSPRAKKPADKEHTDALEESEFKGNTLAQSTFDRFRRLMAKRSLGPADKLDLKVYGLEDGAPSLKLLFAGDRKPWQLNLGRKTYGNGLRYVNNMNDGRVYLVRGNIADNFTRAAKRFFDSRVLPYAAGSAERIEIDRLGQTRTFWRAGKQGGGVYWTEEKDGADAVDAMSTVVSQLSRLRVKSYLPKGEKRSLGAEIEVRLFKESDAAEPAWLRIYPGEGESAVAVSSLTRQAVRIDSKVVNKLMALIIALDSAN